MDPSPASERTRFPSPSRWRLGTSTPIPGCPLEYVQLGSGDATHRPRQELVPLPGPGLTGTRGTRTRMDIEQALRDAQAAAQAAFHEMLDAQAYAMPDHQL